MEQTRLGAEEELSITNDMKPQYDMKQVLMGVEVEAEHSDDPMVAMKITLDHLKEDPFYYSKLEAGGLTDGDIEIELCDDDDYEDGETYSDPYDKDVNAKEDLDLILDYIHENCKGTKQRLVSKVLQQEAVGEKSRRDLQAIVDNVIAYMKSKGVNRSVRSVGTETIQLLIPFYIEEADAKASIIDAGRIRSYRYKFIDMLKELMNDGTGLEKLYELYPDAKRELDGIIDLIKNKQDVKAITEADKFLRKNFSDWDEFKHNFIRKVSKIKRSLKNLFSKPQEEEAMATGNMGSFSEPGMRYKPRLTKRHNPVDDL